MSSTDAKAASRNLTRALLDAHRAAGRDDAIAVAEPGRSWSWARLAEESMRCGAALVAAHVEPGDRVTICMRDSLEFAAVFLGAMRIGAIPVPVSTLLRVHDVRGILANARPTLAVAHADLAPLLDDVCVELPQPPEVLTVGEPGLQRDLGALAAAEAPRCPVVDGNRPSLLLYASGGGSGSPRGVPHTATAVRASFDAWARRVIAMAPGDRVFSTPGLHTAYALGAGLLFPLLAGATACVMTERNRPRAVFAAMEKLSPTVFAAVPSLYGQMIQDAAQATGRPFASVRAAVSGAEPLPAALWERVRATFGVELIHGFGSTEALHFVLSSRPGDARPGAAGKLLDGYEARLVDEDGRPVGVEEMGVLEVRGPSVAEGYWRRGAVEPDPSLEGGWLHTGDRFFVDRDGWYYHCGRTDDRFKVSGRWVEPSEVERTLVAHPAVWESAVVGQEDADGLTIPVAFVVPSVGQHPTVALGHELMEFVKREIAPYKFPRRIEFVGELPKDGRGRVQRWRLRPAAK